MNNEEQKQNLNHKLYKKNLAFILPIAALIGILLIIGILYLISLHKTSKPISEESWPVANQKIIYGTYSPVVTLYGKVESPQATRLEASINADVEKVFVKDGSNVKKGQVLIQLDNRDVKISEKQSKADYEQILSQIKQLKIKYESDIMALKQQKKRVELQKKEVNRLDILYKRRLSSESLLDQAKSTLNELLLRYTENQLAVENYKNILKQRQAELLSAEANLDRAELDVARSIIKAPYEGKVVALNVAIGNRVEPGEVLVELFPISHTEVRAQIPSKVLPIIKKALQKVETLKATATIDQQPLTFTLDRLSGNIVSGQAGVDAIFILDKKNFFIAQNRIVVLRLKLPKIKNLVAVPETAIFKGHTIYLIKNNKLVAQPIKVVGTWYNRDNQALRLIRMPNLKENLTILTTHLLNAREGLKVNIIKAN